MKAHLLSLALCVSAFIATPSQATPLEAARTVEPPAAMLPIKGIVAKDGGKFLHKTWTYETTDGRQFKLAQKLKHVKDLRPYPQRHPIWTPIEVFCKHLEGPAGLAMGGLATYATVHKNGLF